MKKGKTERYLKDEAALNEYLSDLAVEDVEVYQDSAQEYVTGRRLLPLLKKLIGFENLLLKFRKKQHETGILRAFLDEPTLDRDLLKNAAGLKKVIASAKKTLALVYPKSEITIDTALEDEEHQSKKIICRVPIERYGPSVWRLHTSMIGSADFRELQSLAPSAIGLGRAPYKMKVAGEETEYAGTAELVRAILE